jgi:hypothetical protein
MSQFKYICLADATVLNRPTHGSRLIPADGVSYAKQRYMKQIVSLATGISLFALMFSGASCQKETDCKAVVRCFDTLSQKVAEANVLLYALVKSPDGKTTYTADVKAEGTTNSDGEVSFVFKLPAIYDIKATKVVGTRTLTGLGIIKLEEGNTVEKEVTLK